MVAPDWYAVSSAVRIVLKPGSVALIQKPLHPDMFVALFGKVKVTSPLSNVA
jgi:hypothetical protein